MVEVVLVTLCGVTAFLGLGLSVTSLVVGAVRDSETASRTALAAAVVSIAAFCIVLSMTT